MATTKAKKNEVTRREFQALERRLAKLEKDLEKLTRANLAFVQALADMKETE